MPDWQEILSRDGPAVWRSVYRLLGNSADADECFQEVFLDALKLSRRREVHHWRGLLQRLATARAVDRLRRKRVAFVADPAAELDAVCDRAPSPAQSAEDAELAERLRAALAGVPPRQAEVFCLHGLEGWSYQEIATHMEISTDAVGVLLHRARKRLRQLLPALALSGLSRPAGADPAGGAGPASLRPKELS